MERCVRSGPKVRYCSHVSKSVFYCTVIEVIGFLFYEDFLIWMIKRFFGGSFALVMIRLLITLEPADITTQRLWKEIIPSIYQHVFLIHANLARACLAAHGFRSSLMVSITLPFIKLEMSSV
jgi:hypothetical protein